MPLSPRAKSLIRSFRLKPHPEGGHYREIYRSPSNIESSQGTRSALTQIYFLLARGEISRWHRVFSDESWNHLEGSPLNLYTLDPALKKMQKVKLGALKQRALPTFVVPSHHWQAAQSAGEYTLVTCLVAPGFEFQDFSMMDGVTALQAAKGKREKEIQKFL
jgi:predicted cupin superfamily sugar epimerase